MEESACADLLAAATSLAPVYLRGMKRLVCGLQLVAVDGTIVHLPRSHELLKEFGVPVDRLGIELCHYPQAMLVTTWDLVRRIPIAWALGSFNVGEREMSLSILD